MAEMLSQLGMHYVGLRSDEMQILTLILKAMVEVRRDLIQSIVERNEAARRAEQAAPRVGGQQMMADMVSWIGAEFHRPRPNPWPRTTEEVGEELIHILTPDGVTDAILEKNTASVADAECEVIRIDSD